MAFRAGQASWEGRELWTRLLPRPALTTLMTLATQKNQLQEISTTPTTQLKRLNNQPCKNSTHPPSVLSRFFRSSGVTERQKAASDDSSLPSQNQATFQARLLQLQFNNDAAVLATNTAEMTARIAELTATAAEADARTVVARRTTKLMDLESRAMDGRSSWSPSSSPKLSEHSDASARPLRIPTPPPLTGCAQLPNNRPPRGMSATNLKLVRSSTNPS